MQAVLDEVALRLRTTDESLIRIPDICEATGVNYGSVYHHFGSREGVIDAAYDFMFTKFMEEDIESLRHLVSTATSRTQLVQGALAYFDTIHDAPERRDQRAMRWRIVAAALTRPALRDLIGASQTRITSELTSIVSQGQEGGLIRRDLTARSIAVLLLASLIGRVLDDVSTSPIPDAEWRQTARTSFAALLTEP